MKDRDKRFRMRGYFASEAAIAALTAISAFTLALGLQAINLNKSTVSSQELNSWQTEQQEKLQLQNIQKLAFSSYNNLISDWVFLRYLQYFGDDEARKQTGYGLTPIYFDVITKLDPQFISIYPFLSTGVSLYAGQPQESVRLIQQGVQGLSPQIEPEAYIAWRYDGLDRLLFLGDISGAIVAHERAADWAEGAGLQESAKRLRGTAELLRQNPDSRTARFSAWVDVFYQSGDAIAQERAILEILKLGGKVLQTEGGEIQFVPPLTEILPLERERSEQNNGS